MVAAHHHYYKIGAKLGFGIFRESPVSVMKGVVFSYYSAGFYGLLLPLSPVSGCFDGCILLQLLSFGVFYSMEKYVAMVYLWQNCAI